VTEQETYERIKYFAARWVWNRRMQPCPRKSNGKVISWGDWFKEKFGESIFDYSKRKQQEKRNGDRAKDYDGAAQGAGIVAEAGAVVPEQAPGSGGTGDLFSF
jgi:hypothetical protein